MDWHNPTPATQVPPVKDRKKLRMLRSCKIITLERLNELLSSGSGSRVVETVEEADNFRPDPDVDYVSYRDQQPIIITPTTNLYLLELSDGEAYAVLSDFNSLRPLLYFW